MAKKKKAKVKSKMAARPKKKAVKRPVRAKAKAPRKAAARPKPRAAAPRRSAPAVRSKAAPQGSQWVNPMLVVRNMSSALEFYKNGLGFTVRSAMPGPDGKLMHAEIMHNDSLIMLGPENQERGSFAPQGPSPVTLYVFVENVDETIRRAESAGGKVVMAAADMFWGDRCGVVVDPEGHSWMIATHVKDMTPQEMIQAMESMPPM